MSRPRAHARGMTLLEVLISVSILALVATLIYGAFDGMARSRAGLSRLNDRYHQGRAAIARMGRELQSSFLSLHQPLQIQNSVRTTVFVGTNSGTSDRVDFCSFSHQRLTQNAHESDQNELSYFLARDPERSDKYDLVRREAREIDLDPQKGGMVNVLAEDVESLDISYLDSLSGAWTESWDSTQAAGQLNRLPLQIKIKLVLRGGRNGLPIKLETKIPIPMQAAVTFARQ